MELIEVPEDAQVEECIELKNIQYKTMLLNGKPIKETKSANDLTNLDEFLENEKNNNQNEPWCKLNKTIKLKKLIDYAQIPSLVYTKSKKHFTLKNTDKRASTLNSLTPKKMITKDRSSKHEI